MFRDWIAVGLGGMLGALTRFGLMHLFSWIGPAWLPIATLTANVLGCFGIGYASQWAFDQQAESVWWVIGVRVGLLGGLTTFSSFAMDLIREWQNGRAALSLGLVALHLVLGLAAVLVGLSMARSS